MQNQKCTLVVIRNKSAACFVLDFLLLAALLTSSRARKIQVGKLASFFPHGGNVLEVILDMTCECFSLSMLYFRLVTNSYIGLSVESPIFSHGFCNLKMKLDFIYICFKISFNLFH